MHQKKFHASKSAASDHVSAKLEEIFSWAEWQQLNWTTCDWSNFTNFLLSHLRAQWDMKFHSEVGKKAHCGAIMRVDCEVRVGTASEGMSRLARLVLLQRRWCMFERIHFRIEILCQRVIPVVVCPQRGLPFCPKGFFLQEARAAPHTKRS